MINDVKKLRFIFANCDIFRFFKIVANSISKKNGKEFTLKTISHYSEKKSNFRIFLILSLQKTNFLFSERFKSMSRSSIHRTTHFFKMLHNIAICLSLQLSRSFRLNRPPIFWWLSWQKLSGLILKSLRLYVSVQVLKVQ